MNQQTVEDLECHVMYCGEPTIDCCLRSIEQQTYLPSRMVIIEDVSPINESINERHRSLELPYSVKVDADCVLYKKCFEKLYTNMMKRGELCYATSVRTLDPIIGNEGGLHLERSEYIRDLEVPNIIGCDRYIRAEMERKGYEFYEMEDVLAEHWEDWSWKTVYKRFMRMGQKGLFFRSKRYYDIRSVAKRWLKNGNIMAYFALAGYFHGLVTPDSSEKDLSFASEELGMLADQLKYRVHPDLTMDHVLSRMTNKKMKRIILREFRGEVGEVKGMDYGNS